MKVRELIKLLEKEDQDKEVFIATSTTEGIGVLDEIDSICHNGLDIQISGESIFEEDL